MTKEILNLNESKYWIFFGILALAFPIFFFWRSMGFIDGQPFFTLFDDAMISMSYARTFADTGELVWFPGAPRVQGFTNLMWTLYMAGLHKFGLNGSQISAIIAITSIACIYGCSFLSANFVAKVLDGKRDRLFWSCLTAVIIPLLFPLVYWSLRGMEVGVLSFTALLSLTLMGNIVFEKNKSSHWTLFLLSVATVFLGVFIRLDFSILALVLVANFLIFFGNQRQHASFYFSIVIAIIFAIGLVLAFQYLYYGDFVPNTYRLKVDGYSSFNRVLRGLVVLRSNTPLILLVGGSIALALRDPSRFLNKSILLTGGIFSIATVYSVWVGGDAWEGSRMANRYISVSLPFAVIAIILGTYSVCYEQIYPAKKWKVGACLASVWIAYIFIFYPSPNFKDSIAPAILIAVVLLITWGIYRNITSDRATSVSIRILFGLLIILIVSGWSASNWFFNDAMTAEEDVRMSIKGIYLSEATKEGAVIATVWAGSPSYYSRRSMIDLLGKSDRIIASGQPIGEMNPGHNKWNYSYSIEKLRPDVVFQLWIHTAKDEENMESWGYIKKCFKGERLGYFLKQSKNIHWETLEECHQKN